MKTIDVEAQKREETMDKAYDDAVYEYDEQGKRQDKDEREYEDNVFYREVTMVEKFLENFIFSTASSRDTQIDLNLILKALPIRVDKNNYYRVEMFNFQSVQASITAFTNTAQDELFKHYDDRNKARLRKLRTKATVTEDLTEQLKILATNVLSILSKIAATGEAYGKRPKGKDKEIIMTEQ